MILLLRIWSWCSRTILSGKWWKNRGWIFFAFFGIVAMYLVGRNRYASPLQRLTNKIDKIKEEEKKDIVKIEESHTKKEEELDFKLSQDKDKVVKETEDKITKLKARLKEDNKKVKNNSDEINNMFNDILED